MIDSVRSARRSRRGGPILAVALLVASVVVGVPTSAPADASGPGMGFYLSAPFVQTPKYSATVQDFNALSAGAVTAPSTWAGISTTNGVVGTWTVAAGGDFGGATTVAPTDPGDPQPDELATTRSQYASIATGDELSISLAEPRSCFGFWWSAGDDGNGIELYTDGGTRLVASLTTAGVVAILTPRGASITARDGTTTYNTEDYYGHPVSGTGARASTNEPFAYVHAIADGGITFDRIVLSQGNGGGFEFDNFAVGTGCEVDASFVTVDDDVLDESFASSLRVDEPPAPLPLTLVCTPDPVFAGATVTCEVGRGDPNIDILWRAALADVFAEAGVTLGPDGTGTFSFVVPIDARASTYTVDLVEWLAPVELNIVAVAPTRIPAGEGTGGLPLGLLALSVALAGAAVASRRLVNR